MKCVYTDGCMATSLTVDGRNTADMSPQELREIIKNMLDKVEDTAILQDVWMNIMECAGEYENLGECSQCGDYIYEYTLEV